MKRRRARSPANQPHEAGRLALDCTKAQRQLGWTPQFGWAQTLDLTAAWYCESDPERRCQSVQQSLTGYGAALAA